MYKMISVIMSLNLVLLSASNEAPVKKEINSQSKLPKTEFVSKSDKKIEPKLRSKTSARQLKLLDHKKIKNWKIKQSEDITMKRRPDLWKKYLKLK